MYNTYDNCVFTGSKRHTPDVLLYVYCINLKSLREKVGPVPHTGNNSYTYMWKYALCAFPVNYGSRKSTQLSNKQ
jgi:hypothetical protein